jgi:hypothetical protein
VASSAFAWDWDWEEKKRKIASNQCSFTDAQDYHSKIRDSRFKIQDSRFKIQESRVERSAGLSVRCLRASRLSAGLWLSQTGWRKSHNDDETINRAIGTRYSLKALSFWSSIAIGACNSMKTLAIFLITKILMLKMNNDSYFLGRIGIYESTNGMLTYSRGIFCWPQNKIHVILEFKCTDMPWIIDSTYTHYSLTMDMFWAATFHGNRAANGSGDLFSWNHRFNFREIVINALSWLSCSFKGNWPQ